MSFIGRRPIYLDRIGHHRHRPDYWLVILSAILLAVGLVVVYAISPSMSAQQGGSQNYYVGKQLLAIALGVVAFAVVANVPLKWWRRVQKPLIIATAASAIAVRLFGQQVNGAFRWIQVGGLSFQAAELIKFTLIIWLAGFLADRLSRNELSDNKKTLTPILIVLGILTAVIAGMQSDLGSLGVMVAIIAAMTFVIGLPLKRILTIAGVIIIGTILLVAGSGYRRDRLQTYLNPTRDCAGSGYQSCQALITVGSGGMFGLGLGRSVQAYGYLPEAANDSIFAIMAEKFGFIGVTVLIGLFVAFFTRLKLLAQRAPDNYSRLIIVGILAWLSTQTIINIGAMIGLLPLKGITLPFISYGGTSIFFVTGAIGVVFQVSRYTTYEPRLNSIQERDNNDNPIDRRRVRGAYHPNPSGR